MALPVSDDATFRLLVRDFQIVLVRCCAAPGAVHLQSISGIGLDVGVGGPNSSPLVRAWLLAISREKLMGNIHSAMCDDECRRIIAIVAGA